MVEYCLLSQYITIFAAITQYVAAPRRDLFCVPARIGRGAPLTFSPRGHILAV
jgi:hypothetical protein